MFPYTPHMASIIAHANESASQDPQVECCGVILMCEDDTTEYYPMLNAYEWPSEGFEFYPDRWRAVRDRALCIVHSHHGDEQPGILTPDDIESARLLKLPTAVYHTGGVWDYWDPDCWHPWPLRLAQNPILNITMTDFVGWPFDYGRSDCWSVARAWFLAMRGVELPDYARGDVSELEDPEFNPFSSAYKDFGFEEVCDRDDIRTHDLLVFRGANGHATHCGVVVDAANDLGLHHLGEDALSAPFNISSWKPRLKLILRHPKCKSY